jgi:hypothetical protein
MQCDRHLRLRQSIDQSVQSIKHQHHSHSLNSIHPSAPACSRSINQSVAQSIDQSLNQSISRSIDQSVDLTNQSDQPVSRSVDRSIRPINQSVNRSIDRSINQSVHRPMRCIVHRSVQFAAIDESHSFVRSITQSNHCNADDGLKPVPSCCLRRRRLKIAHTELELYSSKVLPPRQMLH